MIAELIVSCFHARTNAHLLHLQTKSFSAHKALNEFYDGIVPLADSLAEAYQGAYGIIAIYPVAYKQYSDAIEMLDDLEVLLYRCQKSAWDPSETYLSNICDEILALVSSTKYKLTFLK